MSHFTKIAAVVLILVAALLGVLAFNLARKPAPRPAPVADAPQPRPQALHDVVVAAKAVPAGQPIAADALKVEQWPARPARAFDRIDAVAGERARIDIVPGDPVLQGMLAAGLAKYLKEGERAVTIPVDEVVGAAGRVQPGDYVDVFFTLDRGSEVSGTQSRLLQSRVRVLAYGAQSLDGPPPGQEERPAGRGGAAAAPRNAMLAVPIGQVNELLLATRSGKLQLALRAPDDEGAPDVALFPERLPVLSARPGLSPEQREQLKLADNQAYAGDSLPQLSGPQPSAPPKAPRAAAGGGSSRTIEVVRGGERETVRY